MESVDAGQYAALKNFERSLKNKGLIGYYDGQSEFAQEFLRQLSAKLNSKIYTNDITKQSAGDGSNIIFNKIPAMSAEARALLSEISEDRSGQALYLKFLGGVEIQANGKQFIESNNSRSRASWEGALRDLEKNGFINDISHKGEVFQITREGYEMAAILKGAS
ncbi:hypothetical protein BV133_2403 [Blastochloris viridis]|nr:hypothetical protein BV133_2403 [Blastochloris viridis]